MSSDTNISSHELIHSLYSNSQIDDNSSVLSIPAENLQKLEGFLKDKGISLPNDPNATDQQRLGNVMSGLEKAGYQVTQGTSAAGSPVFSIGLTADSKVSVSLPTQDELETAPAQMTKSDQTVSAQLSGTPAAPSTATANPYLNVGTAALLRNVLEEIFSKQSKVTQLLGDAGIQSVKNLMANTQTKMQAIGAEYGAKNLKEQANINYNATMLAANCLTGMTSLISANKAFYHNQKAGEAGESSTARTGRETLTLTPEDQENVDANKHKQAAHNAEQFGKLGSFIQPIAQNMASIQQSSTNMAANTQESQAKQAEASLDLSGTMISRNLDTFGKQQQNVHQDAVKTLDLITQFSKNAVDMTRNTFSQA